MSAIQRTLAREYAGSATLAGIISIKLLGDAISEDGKAIEIDRELISIYMQLTKVMARVGSQLGLQRQKDRVPNFREYIESRGLTIKQQEEQRRRQQEQQPEQDEFGTCREGFADTEEDAAEKRESEEAEDGDN
jgi:hypothetical protein